MFYECRLCVTRLLASLKMETCTTKYGNVTVLGNAAEEHGMIQWKTFQLLWCMKWKLVNYNLNDLKI